MLRRTSILITDPPRALRAARRRLRRRPGIDRGRPSGYFEPAGGPPIELWTRYRDAIKPKWRLRWWQTHLLLQFRHLGLLPTDLESLADALLQSRTLPASPDEYAHAVQQLADAHPERIVAVGHDSATGLPRLEAVPTEEELAAWAAYYTQTANWFLDSLGAHGLGPVSRALEIGCGSGFMTLAVAAAGVREVIGCDLQIEGEGSSIGRRELWNRLVPPDADVRFEAADAASLPWEDASFDVAFSFSTLEHVHDPRRVLAELRRVLRPGGFVYHGVDPWFSPGGGHGLCVLDAPWGHVRLARDDMSRYLEEHRPHEARDAMRSYDEDFQQPRLTLAQLADAFTDSGFELLDWNPSSSDTADAHRSLLTAETLTECRRVHPRTTESDLLVDGLGVVAQAA